MVNENLATGMSMLTPEEQKARISAMSDEEVKALHDSVLHAEPILDSGYDVNADSREKPETKIMRVYARSCGVVIEGLDAGVPTTKEITVEEAIYRCRALVDMLKVPGKYGTDTRDVEKLIKMFQKAAKDARNQLVSAGFNPSTTPLIG